MPHKTIYEVTIDGEKHRYDRAKFTLPNILDDLFPDRPSIYHVARIDRGRQFDRRVVLSGSWLENVIREQYKIASMWKALQRPGAKATLRLRVNFTDTDNSRAKYWLDYDLPNARPELIGQIDTAKK